LKWNNSNTHGIAISNGKGSPSGNLLPFHFVSMTFHTTCNVIARHFQASMDDKMRQKQLA
jgi:hypothetical protein